MTTSPEIATRSARDDAKAMVRLMLQEGGERLTAVASFTQHDGDRSWVDAVLVEYVALRGEILDNLEATCGEVR